MTKIRKSLTAVISASCAIFVFSCKPKIENTALNIQKQDRDTLFAVTMSDMALHHEIYNKIKSGQNAEALEIYQELFSWYEKKVKVLERLGVGTSPITETEIYKDALQIAPNQRRSSGD